MKKNSPLSAIGHVFVAVAPTIGKVLASTNPVASAVYGLATQTLASRLKVDPTEAALVAAITPTPSEETLNGIKAADSDFSDKLASLGVQLDQLDLQDVQGARQYATATGNQLQRPMLWWLLIFTSVFSVLFTAFLIFWGQKITAAILDALLPVGTTVITQCFNEVKQAFSFAFGGSQDKATLQTLAGAGGK